MATRQQELANYVFTSYDNPSKSDFQIIADGRVLHLSKFILRSIEYFETFFSTPIGKEKKSLEINYYFAVKRLTMYIYGLKSGLPTVDEELSPDEFVQLIDLADEWLLHDQVMEHLFIYLVHHWRRLLNSNIRYAGRFYLHFRDQGETWVNDDIWTGLELMAEIRTYLENNLDRISSEMLDMEIIENLDYNSKLTIYMKCGRYEKLNNLLKENHTLHLRDRLQKYYDPVEKVFTFRQLSILKDYRTVVHYDDPDKEFFVKFPYTTDGLVLRSLVPFKGTLYRPIEVVSITKRRLHVYIGDVALCSGDSLYINDKITKTVKITWMGEVIEKTLPNLNYCLEVEDQKLITDGLKTIYLVEKF